MAGGSGRWRLRRGPWRSRRGALSVALLLLLVVGAALLPWAAHEGAIPGPGDIGSAHDVAPTVIAQTVVINDSSPGFAPDVITVSANTTLNFTLENTGLETHGFTVNSTRNLVLPIAPGTTPSQVYAFFPDAGASLVNLTLSPNSTTFWNTSIAVPGTYEFLSLVPYQAQLGFVGYLHVLPAGSASRQYVFVNATGGLSFIPSVLSVAPGIPVIFVVEVQGSLSHTFTLVSCSNDTTIVTGVALPSNDACLTNPLVDLNPIDPGGTYASAPTIIPKAGVYWFVCTVPGHFQGGMWGHLYAGIQPEPAGLTPQVQNVIQYGYLALMAVVIGGAAFLVLMGQNERTVAAPAHGH